MKHLVYIGLGSNVGDHRDILNRALAMLDATDAVEVARVSRFIESEPMGPPQGRYVNAAAEVRTDLSPAELLTRLHEIEAALGRDRAVEVRWGPRTCDLDIELIDDMIIDTPELTAPHPRMHERDFVLRPMVELAPRLVHPVLGKTMQQLLADLEAGS